MRNLIDDLLTYSRVATRGKEFTSTDLGEVLEQTLLNLKLSIEENDARITHDALPTVNADGRQMVQLLQNLIANAIKFRGKASPRVHIGVERADTKWIFSVKDNGIGIEPQYMKQIFKVFERLHTREEYPGTGIGLSVCKKIVERHGGKIWVEPATESGSIFYFTIPAKRE